MQKLQPLHRSSSMCTTILRVFVSANVMPLFPILYNAYEF